MALTKEKIFNLYIDKISVERERRLVGRKTADPRANFLWEEALKTVNKDEKNVLKDAYNYSKTIVYEHPGLSAELYFAHPLRVASLAILLADKSPVEAGVIGILHNVFEVSKTSFDEIEKRFGKEISFMLEKLTINRSLQWDAVYIKEYYSCINKLPQNARKVKVIDKFDNLFILGLNHDKEVRSKYLDEVKKYILPNIKRDLPYMYVYFSNLIINCQKTGKL